MMRSNTVYVSGPMSGMPDDNFPAFRAVTARLRAMGYTVVCPTEINPGAARPPDDAPREVVKAYWRECIRADIRALADCGAIVLLPGWQYSEGVHAELGDAHRFGLRIATLEQVIPESEWAEFGFPREAMERRGLLAPTRAMLDSLDEAALESAEVV